MKGVLTSIAYKRTSKKTLVHLFVRGEDKKRWKYTFQGLPYFYIREADLPMLNLLSNNLQSKYTLDPDNSGYIGYDGETIRRIYIPTPPDCPPIRDELHDMGVQTYEADVPYVNRWLIDEGIKLGLEIDNNGLKPLPDYYIKPRYWIIDIEALVETEEKIDVKGPEAIICIGIYDSYDKKYWILYWGVGNIIKEKNATYIPCATERLLLDTFYDMLEDQGPDILMGFNLGGYDIPKIIHRSRHNGINPTRLSPLGGLSTRRNKYKIQGREIVDVYEFSRFLLGTELRFHSLDYVNKKLGHGVGKYKLEDGFNETWAQDPMKLLRYNKRDLDCVLEIELEQDLIAYLDEIRKTVGVTYQDILYKTSLYDIYFQRRLLEQSQKTKTPRRILWTKRKAPVAKYPGAYVKKPIPGVYHNVLVVDFSSLYPNIFITLNIGYSSYDENGDIVIFDDLATPPRYYKFNSKGESLVVDLLKVLLDKRKETKKKLREAKNQQEIEVYTNQDAAFKVIVNSAYGVMGKPGFRLYRPEVGAAITAAARIIIRYTMDMAEHMGYNVFYGDTDSIFIELGKDFKGDPVAIGKKIAKDIGQSLLQELPNIFGTYVDGRVRPAPIDGSNIELDTETVFESMAIWAKKNYLGKILWRKGIYRTEYDWKGRGDVRTDFSTFLRDLQIKLGKSLVDGETEEQRKEYLDDIKARLVGRQVTLQEIGAPRQLKKALADYIADQPHVRGAKYSNEYLGTRYTRGNKPMWAYVIPPEGYPPTDVIAFTEDTVIPNGFEPDLEKTLRRLIQPTIDDFLKLAGEEYKIPPEPLNYGTRGKLGYYFGRQDNVD